VVAVVVAEEEEEDTAAEAGVEVEGHEEALVGEATQASH